jgi:hypothetical protein
MSAKSVTTWYGVCDLCGDEDDDGRPTEQEARDRMWPGPNNEDLCFECVDAGPVQ